MNFYEEYTIRKLKQYINKHNLKDWDYGLNNAKTRCGQCNFYLDKNKRNKILISKFFINDKNVHRKDIKETILHEITHAIVGHEQNHNKVWLKKALEIGCSGERCSTIAYDYSKFKWVMKCNEGCKSYYHRKSKYNCNDGRICRKHNLLMKIFRNF